MDRDAIFHHFFPDELTAMAGFYRTVENFLPESGALLDLGCGDNIKLAHFRTSDLAVWGADLHRHPALQHPEWFRLLGPCGEIPFADDTFDVITSCWVLEHIKDPQTFLKEVARVLRPGGVFVSLSVSGLHYVTWAARLFGLLPHRVTQALVHKLYRRKHYDTFPTYYKLNTLRQMQQAARHAGLGTPELLRIAHSDYFSFFQPLECAAIVADWLLDKLFPGLGRLFFVATFHKLGESAQTPSLALNSEKAA